MGVLSRKACDALREGADILLLMGSAFRGKLRRTNHSLFFASQRNVKSSRKTVRRSSFAPCARAWPVSVCTSGPPRRSPAGPAQACPSRIANQLPQILHQPPASSCHDLLSNSAGGIELLSNTRTKRRRIRKKERRSNLNEALQVLDLQIFAGAGGFDGSL